MEPNRIVVSPATVEGGIGATVHVDGEESRDLWMTSRHIDPELGSDLSPWAITLLPYAMRRGLDLHLDGDMDSDLHGNMASAQELLHTWYPKRLGIVEVTASRLVTTTPAPGQGAFFSAGVDSFYTLATATPPLDHIVLVGGFDIPLAQTAKFEQVSLATARAAEEFGVSAIEVMTNTRTVTDEASDWGREQHGASLAAVGYALRHGIGSVRLASTYSEETLHPWGSHPALDCLWSSSAQAVTHDSTAVTRVEKVAAVMESASAREGLHVCWLKTDLYNCGTCEKCLRTRIDLRATGNDGKCATLAPLRTSELDSLALEKDGVRIFAWESLQFMDADEVDDPRLRSALDRALRRGTRTRMLHKAIDGIPGARRGLRFALQVVRRGR